MQELIEKLSIKSGDSFHAIAFYHDNDYLIKEALEKEKEQILRAFELGMHESLAYDANSITYYNQTYNQNK